nr:PAS domain-containing protein [Chroococcidiopsis cubana]
MTRSIATSRAQQIAVAFEEFYPPLNTWFAVHAYPSQDGISVYFQNINERKRLEAIARTRERELADFLENASVGIHWVGADGIIVWANQAELNLLGYTREEYIGQHIAKFHADREVIDDILQRLNSGETLCDYEARLLCKDGSIRDVSIGSNVFGKDKQFIHTRCFTRDITDRKRMENQLQQTMQLQQAVLNSANYTIISTTTDGTILTFNAAAEKLLGYSASEIVGKTTPVIIHDREEVVSRARELTQELGVTIEPGFEVFVAKARRGEPTEQEWTYIRKDGSRFPVLLSISAMYDANGKITGFLVLAATSPNANEPKQNYNAKICDRNYLPKLP